MSTSISHIYDTLPDASDHLRLLTVHADSVFAPIRCTLQTVSFRDKPSYDALSYTWGDSTSTKSIGVDGFEIQVTANLEQALRHLRNVEHDLALWVDAVCINQSDTSEKSHQVALMGKIYQECAQVRIWLGCDSSKCGLAQSPLHTSNQSHGAVDPFELVRHQAENRHISEWPCFHTQSDHGHNKIVYKANDKFDIISEAFLAIAESPWWTRMWTVQEAILPDQGQLTYDTWSISIHSIMLSGQYLQQHAAVCCYGAFLQLPDVLDVALRTFANATATILKGRRRDEDRNVIRLGLQVQHVVYGGRACKDPRDKVYGLLGVVDNISLKPDYTWPVNEVFLRATCHMLLHDWRTLMTLTGPYHGPGPVKWASWVRQFDAPFTAVENQGILHDRHTYHDTVMFDACDGHESKHMLLMGQPALGSFKPNQIGLQIRGRRVGNITLVSENFDTTLSLNRKKAILRRWTLNALDWNRRNMSGDENSDNNTSGDASRYPESLLRFWRTISGGVDVLHNAGVPAKRLTNFTPASIDRLNEVLSWLSEKRVLGAEAESKMALAIFGRSYFKADNNGQGLCYPNACIGDEVWVLDGGRVPFILRPIHLNPEEREALKPLDDHVFMADGKFEFKKDCESSKPPEGYYQFIGDCYFDGFMHGEAMRNDEFQQTIVLV